ncbi:unnamed protein product [Blepharisma stoltei]|uniref:Uncharacterized protein n=1 Tax=Blepharisma stoltei TaxID=1481888 RepID=A0AAU9KN48_9CILI|nr:unnamed protein product [Blepharisma stoltei]
MAEKVNSEYKPFTHPKSAPVRPAPESSTATSSFGGHIFSMHSTEESRRQKQLQQKTYFQELTRQIQEKKEDKPIEAFISSKASTQIEPSPSTSTDFGSDLKKLPYPWVDSNKPLPRYQKKHEIENHLGLSVNGSHFLGGPLQRDEALLLKLKKEEQQKQMQMILNAQIEEKNRKAQKEKEARLSYEIQDEERIFKDREILKREEQQEKSPEPKFLNTLTTEAPPKSMIVFSTAKEVEEPQQQTFISPPISPKKEVPNESLDYLSQLCKQLMEEQEQLRGKLKSQEDIIEDLKQSRDEPKRAPNNNNNSALRRKPPAKVNIPPTKASQNKLKQQHDLENAKIAAIQEKIENARKKKAEQRESQVLAKQAEFRKRSETQQAKPKTVVNNRRISEVPEVRPDSREIYKQNNQIYRLQSAFTPTLPPDSPELPNSSQTNFLVHELSPKMPFDRQNLDSAGKSYFIYPDSQGSFNVGLGQDNKLKESGHLSSFLQEDELRNSQADELDKFVEEHNKKSPYISQFNSARSVADEREKARFTCTTFEIARKDAKPLVANKAGFPSNIFRRP